MRSHPVCRRSIGLIAALIIAAVAVLLVALPAEAGTSGTLKLKVRECYGSSWMSGAGVSVTIYRPGVGSVDSGSGTTNSSGYVAIAFEDLEDGDEAHVVVTPAGGPPTSNHTYYWIGPDSRGPGLWDVGILADDICADGWYDVSSNTILCLHG